MKKQLIATDFDGTFYRNGRIDPLDREAVAAWRAHGGLFGFVTGRGLDFLETARGLGLEADFFLVYTGALLALPDGTKVKEYRIPAADFAALARHFAALPDAEHFDKPNGSPFYYQYYATFPTPARALEAAAEVNRLFGGVTAYVNGPHVNIGKKGCGKTQGVFDALAYFGLPRDAAAVFGDDYNDMDMIASHGGWAVDTAQPPWEAIISISL